MLNEKYFLSNGVEIPKIGLGTWYISNKDVVEVVQTAIDIGYRHIDTAAIYRNEVGVGQGIKASGVKREDIFITTKIAAGAKTYVKAKSSIDKALKKLDLDYIDLVIIHSPKPWTHFHSRKNFDKGNLEAWKALEAAYKDGKVKAIGLSNFEKSDIENILKHCTVKPMINQVLAHIGNVPFELIDYCENNDILVEAYSPIAHGALLENEAVLEIAKKYDCSVAQLSIRYLLQLGLLPLPKTAKRTHMINNADVNFDISSEDMETLRTVAPVRDYGDANMMPVFGGKLNLKNILKILFTFKN